MAQKGGPCYRGQQLLDKRSLLSCREPRRRALPFPTGRAFLVQRGPYRHASGSPFGGAGERSETERANKNRAAGNVRTCGAVYLLEEIVLVENGSLNPVGTIRIVYFIWRKKSTRVAKIGGTCSCAKQNTLKSLDSKVFQTGAAIQIRTGDLILTKDALYQLSYSSKWRPGSGSNRRPPA